MTTNVTEEQDLAALGSQPPRGPGKLVLLLVSLAFSAAVFLTLDWFHTARLLRALHRTSQPDLCRVRDPIRYHALKPNCEFTDYWGADSYKFYTNSLGFRDEKIRDVPVADPRPRILLLGDSFVEGKLAWNKSIAGRIAAHFPQYDFLNGGLAGYSPSNYLTTARMVLDKGIDIDEVIVFLDNSAVQHEAAFYRDIDANGAVTGIGYEQQHPVTSWYVKVRGWVSQHFVLTAQVFRLFDRVQRFLIRYGYYQLPMTNFGDPFDYEMSAWTYRKVNESDVFPAGYAPLGVEAGVAKEEAKMTLLCQELQKRNIPISVVLYPHLGQLVHDTAENRQVQLFRQWCRGRCKRFITVLPAFYAAKEQCPHGRPGCWYPQLFVVGDIHFNAAGNAMVADAVINSLTEDPPGKRPDDGNTAGHR